MWWLREISRKVFRKGAWREDLRKKRGGKVLGWRQKSSPIWTQTLMWIVRHLTQWYSMSSGEHGRKWKLFLASITSQIRLCPWRDVILLSPRTSALLTHRSGFTSIPVTSLCIRYPGPFSCHASRFPVDKSLCLSIWSIKCCKFCDEGQSIKFLKRVCVSYRGAASMLLTVFDSYWRKIDDLNPPHIRASLLTSLLLSHPPPLFFFSYALPFNLSSMLSAIKG